MTTPTYTYDGTFEGLLTAMAQALDEGSIPADILPAGVGAADLFAQPVLVTTLPDRAAALSARLERIDPHIVHQVLHGFLAEEPDLGRPLSTYVRLSLERRECVDGFLTNPDVRRVVMTARRVGGESHRLKGLLRFRELKSGPLWAPVEPDANVVLLLALHFRRRLSAQFWVIHDMKRNVAVAWDGKDLEWLEGAVLRRRIEELRPDELSQSEQGYQDLWRTFFRSIAIPERINPELQRRNMPRRYWKHLVEK